MSSVRSKTLLWSVVLVLGSAMYLGSRLLRPRIADRVYTIGWQNSPPFQQKAEDGSPAGLAIDLVRDAARRRGIRLHWVWYPDNSEAALRAHKVDLWPLITITPERQKVIHITKPYLQHDYSLAVLAGSSYFKMSDLEAASVSYAAMPIIRQRLTAILPHARAVAAGSARNALENVCAHVSDAALLDDFTAGALLVSGLSCGSQPLRMFAVPDVETQLGVGSTFEAADVADEIRRGLDISFDRGELARLLRSSGYFSPRNMDYFSAMMVAQRRERWLISTIGLFAAFLLLTAFAAFRMRSQRNRIRAADNALRASEVKFRLLANNLSEMVLAFDMEGRLVFANPAVERTTGYSLADLQSKDFGAHAHPDDRAVVAEHRERLLRGESFQDLEYRLLCKDGQVKWVVSTWTPVYDESGRQVGIQGCKRDITPRKLAEQSLRKSEHRFRELLERVQLVAVMTGRDGTIAFCNDYTLAITGWSREDLIGRPAADLLSLHCAAEPDDVSSGGKMCPMCESAIITKDGSKRWIQWSSTTLHDSEGRPAGFATLGEDVTEVRALRAEAARRESEERFRDIADVAPLMIWVAGPNKGCTFVNKGWRTFSGRTLEEELGDGWLSAVHPDDRRVCGKAYSGAFEARRSFQVEKRVRRADGEYRWILSSGEPRYGPGGEFAGYIGTFNDITDLKRSRDEAIAHQKLETVGRLAAGVAHDFNNLLGAVLAEAELAQAEVASGNSPDEPLKHIRAVAVRGAGIVRQLMIYSGQDDAAAEPVDLSSLVEEMVELLRVVVSKRAVLRSDLARDLPAVHANPAQLRQVVMNLVTNASEAIGDRDGVITLRTAAAGRSVTLEVSDTGGGIRPDAQAKVFDPFFTTKPTGNGLGLTVVHRIVRAAHGAVRFETELGRGTKFSIRLPATTYVAAPVGPLSGFGPAEAWSDAGTVLVVEDEAPLRGAVVKMLRRRGIPVIEAADGTIAMDFIRDLSQPIAAVLLDITLPGVPSRDVLAECRRLRAAAKVIVTSAYGQSHVDEAFPGMQVDAFIRKPFQLGDLIALLRRFVPAASRTGAAPARPVARN